MERLPGELCLKIFHLLDHRSLAAAPQEQNNRVLHLRGLRIITEGNDYYLIHQGEIQKSLGMCNLRNESCDDVAPLQDVRERHSRIPDTILFFLGDLEAACAAAKHLQM
ncbi:hypothetical protein BHE74_00010491 [Ensete ventricosum]|nr:hypothetical protein BHE74_00010491 [Ensete ventricosum]